MTRFSAAQKKLLSRMSLGAVAVIFGSLGALHGGEPAPKPPATQPALQQHHQRMMRALAMQQEILAAPQGIHKLSDGSLCVKDGIGMATIHADGRGCGTGWDQEKVKRPAQDEVLMTGVSQLIFMDAKDQADLGINPNQARALMDAYSQMDHQGTNPNSVLKVYEAYAKAADGDAKSQVEKALLEKVRAVGQAYADVEVKRVKDVKKLLTPAQQTRIHAIGFKFLHPHDNPIV